MSDKPPWIQALPPLTAADKAQIEKEAIGDLQELSAVDDMVRKIITDMPSEVLENTVVIFTSDNGVHHGEHRRLGTGTKSGPYDVGLPRPAGRAGARLRAGTEDHRAEHADPGHRRDDSRRRRREGRSSPSNRHLAHRAVRASEPPHRPDPAARDRRKGS